MRKRRKKFVTNTWENIKLHEDDTDLNDLNEMAIEEQKDNISVIDDLSFGQIFLDDLAARGETIDDELKNVVVSVFPKIDKFGSVVPRS